MERVTLDLTGTPFINIEIVQITPETAAKMLQKNINRRIKTLTADKYGRDMKNGKWSLNGDTIVVDEDGYIKNGQHRLTGCVRSESPFWTLLVTIKSEQAKNYDNNVPRRVGDRLKMGEYSEIIDPENKYLNCPSAAAIAMFSAFTYKSMRATSASEVADFIAKHADAISFAVAHKSHAARISKVCIWAAVAAAYECGYSTELLENFCDVISTGITDDKRFFPVIKFRNWCLKAKGGSETLRRETYMRAQFALKAVDDCRFNAPTREATKEYYSFSKED